MIVFGDMIDSTLCAPQLDDLLVLSWEYGNVLGVYRDNEKENGTYYSISGIKWDYRREYGNMFII